MDGKALVGFPHDPMKRPSHRPAAASSWVKPGCCNLNFQRLRSFSGGSSSEKRSANDTAGLQRWVCLISGTPKSHCWSSFSQRLKMPFWASLHFQAILLLFIIYYYYYIFIYVHIYIYPINFIKYLHSGGLNHHFCWSNPSPEMSLALRGWDPVVRRRR